MKVRCFLAVFLVLHFAGCAGSAYLRPAQGDLTHVKRLAVVVEGEPEFKVLDHRATGLGAGALFGVVGVMVNSAYNNSKDSKQEDKLEPQTKRISYRESFIEQLKKLLEESKRFQKIDFIDEKVAQAESFDAVLKLSIQEWGIKVIDERAGGLVPFMTVEIALTRQNGRVVWKERDDEVGSSAHSIEEYRGRENLLSDTVQTVVKDTAYRITSTLIYS